MVSTTLIIIVAALKTLQSQAPEWQRNVDRWIQKDKESFLKFRENVFKTMDECKHALGSEGYEKI